MYFKTDSILKEKFNKAGIKSNEKIAILGNNSEDYIKLLIQILNLDAIIVPVSPLLPVSKVHNALNNIGCSKIIVDEQVSYEDDPEINSIPLGYFLEELKSMDLRKLISIFNIYKISETPDKNASIIFTSGSTNLPKAVLHTIGNHWFNAKGSNDNIEFNNGDCWLISLPLNHVSGFSTIFKALAGKADICVRPGNLTLTETMGKKRITHLSLIPSQLSELISNPDMVKILKKLKAILIGGASAPLKLIEEAASFKLPVYNSYGSTEMASQITCTIKNDTLAHLKTSGRILKYREIKISENGEISVKGRTLFKGYIEKDNSGNEIIMQPLDEDGWFNTGDCGFLDEEGYLHVSGRKDLMFVYKGENIFPEEIESVLKEIKEVDDALVVLVTQSGEEQTPVAFLKSKNYLKLDFESIKKSLSARIEPFKIPKIFLKWPKQAEERSLKPDRESFKRIALREINSR